MLDSSQMSTLILTIAKQEHNVRPVKPTGEKIVWMYSFHVEWTRDGKEQEQSEKQQTEGSQPRPLRQ